MSSEELVELRKISKILLLSNADSVERHLSEYATTDERRRIWVMIDGTRTQEEIAKLLHLARRTVNIFVNVLTASDLVEARRGEPPKRILDYVPPSWIELVKPMVAEESPDNIAQSQIPSVAADKQA